MPSSDEHRRNSRVSFETSIDLTCGTKIFSQCETDNLSTKGVLIHGIKGLQVGDTCDLTLHLSGGHDLKLQMNGDIQRVTETGVGIEFTETDLDSFTHLKKIIYYNSENPDIINESY